MKLTASKMRTEWFSSLHTSFIAQGTKTRYIIEKQVITDSESNKRKEKHRWMNAEEEE